MSKTMTDLAPALPLAVGGMIGLAMIGGIAGAVMTSGRSRTWVAAATGGGVAVGAGLGYWGGAFLVKRTIAKLEAANASKAAA